MSYPGTPSAGGSGSGFPAGVYPQPIGTLSGASRPSGLPGNTNTSSITQATAGMSIQGNNASPFTGSSSGTLPHHQQSTIPITTTPVGTAPRKQLAAAAAAGAAMGAAKSGRPKGPYKKAGGAGGGGGGPSKRGGRGGGRGGRAGSSFGPDDDDDKGGKDSDDDNEDEPEVSIEEQFILRLPPGEMLDRFREKVIAREVDESVKLKFTGNNWSIKIDRNAFTLHDLLLLIRLETNSRALPQLYRCAAGNIHIRGYRFSDKAGRSSYNHRGTKDTERKADVQDRGYLADADRG